MENLKQEIKPPNKWTLIQALIFLAFGTYRFYQYFIKGVDYSTFRILFAAAFLVFGFIYLFRYLKR